MLESEEQLRSRIAENIAYYRKQNDDTQADLAEKLCYSDKSISKWERGDSTPDVYILARIADLYSITVQDLLREKKVPKARTRRIIITLMSVGLVWLTMTVLFVLSKIFHILPDHAWLLFIHALPISGIVCQVFSAKWGNYLLQVLSCTLILWGTALSLVLSLPFESLELLFIVCGIMQILLILFFILKYQRKRNRS